MGRVLRWFRNIVGKNKTDKEPKNQDDIQEEIPVKKRWVFCCLGMNFSKAGPETAKQMYAKRNRDESIHVANAVMVRSASADLQSHISGSSNGSRSWSEAFPIESIGSGSSPDDIVRGIDSDLSVPGLQFVQRLGSGDTGSVYLAKQKCDGAKERVIAAKVIDKKKLKRCNKKNRARTELEILRVLDHPFLPRLYGVVENERWSCLLTEFCPAGDLFQLRQRQPARRFNETTVKYYAAEVVTALEYLHKIDIIYRDLKPENVLVQSDGHIMLTDFDLSLKSSVPARCRLLPSCIISSTHQRAGAEPVYLRSMSFVGTHEYLAPEIVSCKGHGCAVDWWTLGIFIFELLYGITPFRGDHNDVTLTNIVQRALEFPSEPLVSAEARDLVSVLLAKDPKRRMGSTVGAAMIRQHPFFHGVKWELLWCAAPPYLPPLFDREGNQSEDDSCPEMLQPLQMKYRKEKQRIDEIGELKQRGEAIMFALPLSEQRIDLARDAGLRNGDLVEMDPAIAKLEGETSENLMLTETVGPENIAEVWCETNQAGCDPAVEDAYKGRDRGCLRRKRSTRTPLSILMWGLVIRSSRTRWGRMVAW